MTMSRTRPKMRDKVVFALTREVERRRDRFTGSLPGPGTRNGLIPLTSAPDTSVLSVQLEAGLPMESVRANVKLVISGGQNEPRDAIAGAIWALLVLLQKNENAIQNFHKFSILVWLIWLIPYFSPMFFSMVA